MQAQTERAAQTNQIAEAVQCGQLDSLTLWASVRGYAAKKARRWTAALNHRCGTEFDDLMQEAYLAAGCQTVEAGRRHGLHRHL